MSTESQVRRLAARHGLQLSKSRRRSPYLDDYARYFVSNPSTSNVLLTSEYGVTLEEAEELVRERASV